MNSESLCEKRMQIGPIKTEYRIYGKWKPSGHCWRDVEDSPSLIPEKNILHE